MTLSKFRTIVSTHWLRGQLFSQGTVKKASALRVLDASAVPDPAVDGYAEFYQQSHIPHATYFNIHELCPLSSSSLHKYPVPDLNRFQDYAESLGVSNNTHVVTYDRSNTTFALKAWWMFRLFGHDNVSVLDGGFKKWLMDGFAVTTDEPEVQRSSFKPVFQPALIHNFEDMVENLQTKDKQVIDARGAAAFHNQRQKLDDGGHIPGAKNIPFPGLFQEDGTFKEPPELKSAFDAAGVDLGRPVVAMCETALTACGLAAAAHILGKETLPVYNGSFREWSQRAEPDQIALD